MPDFGTLPSQKTGLADLLSVPFLMPHFYIFLILFFAHCRIQVVQIMHQLQKLAHIVLSKPGEDLIPDLIIFLFGLFRGGFSFRSSADLRRRECGKLHCSSAGGQFRFFS